MNLFHVLLFQLLIQMHAHHQVFEFSLLHFLILQTRSARILLCLDLCPPSESCWPNAMFVTTAPDRDPSRCS